MDFFFSPLINSDYYVRGIQSIFPFSHLHIIFHMVYYDLAMLFESIYLFQQNISESRDMHSHREK